YFVATTCHNVSPSAVVELLSKMAKVFKDFCGVLNEESIRKNFVLVYELLDEMVDFGHPQTTNTEHLKSCIHNEAVVIEAPKLASLSGLSLPQWNPRTVPSNAVHRPVGPTQNDSSKSKKNEIFVDILERITVLMSSNGFVINSAIDGSIQMKSYLMGNPELKLALNEDINIKNMELGGLHGGYGSVVLDDCNFHECVDLQDFSELRTLSFYPPDGEFAVMNYRITGDFRVPFRVCDPQMFSGVPTQGMDCPCRWRLPVAVDYKGQRFSDRRSQVRGRAVQEALGEQPNTNDQGTHGEKAPAAFFSSSSGSKGAVQAASVAVSQALIVEVSDLFDDMGGPGAQTDCSAVSPATLLVSPAAPEQTSSQSAAPQQGMTRASDANCQPAAPDQTASQSAAPEQVMTRAGDANCQPAAPDQTTIQSAAPEQVMTKKVKQTASQQPKAEAPEAAVQNRGRLPASSPGADCQPAAPEQAPSPATPKSEPDV
ncbi:unnamed protein product, partial [Polarella glacialis]